MGSALTYAAVWRRFAGVSLVSDAHGLFGIEKGGVLLTIGCTERCAQIEVGPSVGSRGGRSGNALGETEIGLLRTAASRRSGP